MELYDSSAMKLATNIKMVKGFGTQFILDEQFQVLGINLLLNDRILVKKRFKTPLAIKTNKEEIKLVNETVLSYFEKNTSPK